MYPTRRRVVTFSILCPPYSAQEGLKRFLEYVPSKRAQTTARAILAPIYRRGAIAMESTCRREHTTLLTRKAFVYSLLSGRAQQCLLPLVTRMLGLGQHRQSVA
jgi:hypothetical protein